MRTRTDRQVALKVGANLRELRQSAGLSQTDVEKLCGIPKARLSRYENGWVEPSITSALRLAAALKVNLEAVVFGVDEEMG